MSKISERLKLKLIRSQKGELIASIIFGVWGIIGSIFYIADIERIPAVMIVLGITAFLIAVIDGYFIFSVFYYKRKIRRQNQEDGVITK